MRSSSTKELKTSKSANEYIDFLNKKLDPKVEILMKAVEFSW